MDILQPFTGAHPKQPKCRGGGKGKQPQQKPKNLPPQIQDDQCNYEDTNNYYHNENYRGQSRGHRHIDNLEDPTQQHTVCTNEVDASLFTMDTTTPCDYNISTDILNSNNLHESKINTTQSMGIYSQSKHKYRNVFGNANIQYHDFDNGDALTFKDQYMALLQQELQNLYWCLHDLIATKSYQISSEMDIETMPHAMYFSGNKETITKINQVPSQVIDYDYKGMFQAKLMDNTQVEIFIDNGPTPSILPLNVCNKYPILQKYPKTESHTSIHTGGGMIVSFLDRYL